MKKLIALLLALVMLVSVLTACGKTEEKAAEEPKEEVAAEEKPEEKAEEAEPEKEEEAAEEEPAEEAAEEAAETEESGEWLDGLEVTVHKTLDRSNVIVRFNLDLFGYTDVPNYTIVDENGNKIETLASANSAFWDLGGEVTNVFKLSFSEPLAVGTYTVTVNNIVDAIDGPFHNFVPCETTIVITDDIPESAE